MCTSKMIESETDRLHRSQRESTVVVLLQIQHVRETDHIVLVEPKLAFEAEVREHINWRNSFWIKPHRLGKQK